MSQTTGPILLSDLRCHKHRRLNIGVGYSPTGLAYDSGRGEVFVANTNAGTVSVISDFTNTVVATVNVGNGPLGVAYDSGRGEVFVANYGSKTVSAISDANNSVVATFGVGPAPFGVAYDSRGRDLRDKLWRTTGGACLWW